MVRRWYNANGKELTHYRHSPVTSCGGPYSPSIRHSFTISHSFFISDSGRYLHCLACSNHSSGPAFLDRCAGPGCGSESDKSMAGMNMSQVVSRDGF